VVFATLSLFGGSWWSHDSGWGFPWGLVLTGALIWWLVQRSHNRPDADKRASSQAAGTPLTLSQPTTTSTAVVLSKPRRRSGGPLMALLAVGLVLVTYGSLMWLSAYSNWTGDHRTIAMAGSLAAIGLLLVVLGLVGWRAGFVAFLAVALAIATWSSSVVPAGIRVNGRVGEATWAPTSVTSGANYRLGVGNGVLDLRGLPIESLSEARLSANVGIGEMKVLVPDGLTVKVMGHVGLGEILTPAEAQAGGDGQGGTDVSRSIVVGDGPTEVLVDAGVGVGQLSVVKE
jgi:hypothetical protein